MSTKDRPSIVIHGYYYAGNYGDDIILLSMINSLKAIKPDVDITVLSRNIVSMPDSKALHVISRNDMKNTAQAIKNSDLFICGGGGIFQDYSGFNFDDHFGPRIKGLDYYALPVEMAYLMGKPVMFYAVGVGPLFNPMSQRYLKTIINWADVITVRDQQSADIIMSLNPAARPVVAADPAVNYVQSNSSPPLKASGKKYVGICLRTWFFNNDQLNSFISSIKEIADYLVERYGYSIILFPFNKSYTDLNLIKTVYKNIKNKTHAAIYEKMSMEETIGVISQMDFTIGMRLHSVIMSTSNYVPAIAVSYDDKVSNYMRQLGMEEYSLTLKEIMGSNKKETIDNIVANKLAVETKLKSIIPKLKEKEKENAKMAINLLRGIDNG